MPIPGVSPLGAALGFVGSYVAARNAAKAQAQQDAQARAQQAFQNQMLLENQRRSQSNSDRTYGLDLQKFKNTQAVEAAKTKDAGIKAAQKNVEGLYADRVQSNLAPVLQTIQKAIAAGKYDEGLFQRQIAQVAAATAASAASRYGKPGQLALPGDAVNKVVMQTMAAIRSEHQRALQAQQQKDLARQRFAQELQLRQTPTYANLHPRAGSGRGRTVQAIDADTINAVSPQIINSAQPLTTAEHMVMAARAAGANTKTLEQIRTLGTYWQRKKHPSGSGIIP